MESEPDALVFGHPRGKGVNTWTPIDLKYVDGESKTAPTGVFRVRVGNRLVLQVGPEKRPFPELRALDIDAVVRDVLMVLGEIRDGV